MIQISEKLKKEKRKSICFTTIQILQWVLDLFQLEVDTEFKTLLSITNIDIK